MVKEFKDWIDEFVEQGADPERVTKWPEDFGGGGPGAIKLQEKIVNPEKVSIEVTPDTSYDGLSKVTIEAIELQNKEISPSTSSQSVIPDKGYDGLGVVKVNAITLQDKTVSPTEIRQEITCDNNYDGLGKVVVEAVEPVKLQSKTVNPSTARQEIRPDSNYDGLGAVIVEAVNLQDKTTKPTTSSQEVIPDEGYVGLGKVTIDGVNLQEKSVSPTTTAKEVTADSSFDGLSKVTVEAVALQDKVVKPTTSAQDITPDDGYLGLGKVTVEASEVAETAYYQFIFNNHEDISSKRFSIDWSKLPDFFQETFGINPDSTFSEIAVQMGTSDYAIRFPLAVGDTNTNNKLYFNSSLYFILEINNNNAYLKRDGHLNGFLDFDISAQASKTLREAISLLPTTTTGTSQGIYALLILGVITLTEIN